MTTEESPSPPVQGNALRVPPREPIAIIGMGCRFPGGSNSPTAFWELLTEGRDAITTVPRDRWALRSFYDPDPQKPGKAATCRGGFIDQFDHFDAHFFGVSPREADYLDPQQRILLEVAWNSLEDAGIVPERLAGRPVGVFMGAFTLDYKILQFQDRDAVSTHTAVGAMMTIIAARLSYLLDLRGPSMSVDTACSSSLVAVHLACQSLWNQECELALAGGVNVMATPDYTIAESKGGFLSPDGASKAFDSRANGYVRGEGAGVAVLKPLAAAQDDGDPIYAIIRGAAINHDGRTNGITVPRQEAQEALMISAYAQGGVAPHQIHYVEAHGTGTPVGDPIEARALNNVLARNRPPGEKCVIGSCKTNIGHLEAAAGIAGLIKTALILKHRQVPPHLHFQKPNPDIPFDEMALRIPTALEPLPDGDGPIFAGVNSFGFGGTNAHILLESPPASGQRARREQTERDIYLLPLSARSPEALRALAEAYADLLADDACPPLADLLYTATVRRSHHPYRLAVTGDSTAALRESLLAFLIGEERPNIRTGRLRPGQEPRVVFLYTGMGPQWWAMGRELYQREPLFRETLEQCDQIFSRHAGWSILEEMLANEESSQMAETFVAQPANVVLQLALTALWRSWGVEPDAVVGHSVGEIVSAYTSGMLSLEDTLLVAFHRSRLQQQATGTGSMLAVGLAEAEVKRYLAGREDKISIAAINSPHSVTLAGKTDVLQKLAAQFDAEHIFSKMLQVQVPYHSPCMEPIREEILESLASLMPRPASLPIYSTVTGRPIEGLAFDAAYWWKNVRHPVRFAAAAGQIIEDGYSVFVEVGPHPVLAYSIRECLDGATAKGNRAETTIVASLRRKVAEKENLLRTLGALYCVGRPVAWERLYNEGNVVPIPTYPWQRERYWAESETPRQQRLGHIDHPLLGQRLATPQPGWEGELNPHYLPYLDDHCIQGATVYPGAGYVEMALAAAATAYGSERCLIEGLAFHRALFLTNHSVVRIQLLIDPQTSVFQIYAREASTEQPWILNSSGRLRQLPPGGEKKQADFRAEIARSCPETVTPPACYAEFQQKGFDYGPTFQGIRSLQRGRYDALAEIELPASLQAESESYFFHPALLDACFQVMVAIDAFGKNGNEPSDVYLPVRIERLALYALPERRVWSHAHIVEKGETSIVGDIQIFDAEGRLLATIEGFHARSLAGKAVSRPEAANDWLYELVWQPQQREESAQPVPPGAWLVLADRNGAGAALVQQLSRLGHRCTVVEYGEDDAGQRTDHVRVNPADKATFAQLLAETLDGEKTFRGIVYLWGLDAPAGPDMTLDELAAFEEKGPLALMHLVQALAARGATLPLWLVTRGAQPVGGEGVPLAVAQASLWGLGRVIGHQEHVKLWRGAVDLDPTAPASAVENLVAELLASDEEDQIAFRQGQRYVARLVRSEETPAVLPPSIRPDGSYLIAGGHGALGLLVARWLAEQGARSLVLLGRTPLPPRRDWNAVAPGSPLAARIASVRSLEALGATVHVAAVDLTNELQLLRFLDEYEAEGWPPIRGVIHSAGLVEDVLLTEMDDETFTRVWRPKVMGAWALHRAFRQVPLDFFMLFSSVASLIAQAGQGNYAAGNAFLDALAFYRRAQGLPALSINWGPWRVGMIQDLDLVEHYRRRGMDALAAEAGIEILQQLVSFRQAQVAVIKADWPLVLEYYPRVPRQVAHLDEEPEGIEEGPVEGGTFLEQLARLEEDARAPFIQAQLRVLLARVLRISLDRLEAEIPLTALGMDSLIATELRNRIDLQLGINLSVVELLQGLTIAELTERALAQLAPRLEEEARLAALLSGELDATILQELATEETLAQLLDEVERLSEEDVARQLG